MKLYNRLLMEGVFLFWDDDNECDYYLINTYINQLDKKIKIKEYLCNYYIWTTKIYCQKNSFASTNIKLYYLL